MALALLLRCDCMQTCALLNMCVDNIKIEKSLLLLHSQSCRNVPTRESLCVVEAQLHCRNLLVALFCTEA